MANQEEFWTWAPFAEALGLGLFPWLSQFKELDIHFELVNFRTKSINNFFANLFASSIYFYISQSLPYEMINLPSWWIFILVSFILSLAFYINYLYNKVKVKNGVRKSAVIVNFILYIAIFCLLTAGFGLLKVRQGYYILSGVVQTSESNGINGATILFEMTVRCS